MTLALILNGVLDPKEALDNVNPFIKDELYEALEVADYV